MLEKENPQFLNLTGQFIPEERSPFSRLRHFLVEQWAEKAFWTPGRRQLARRVVGAVNQELEPFGAPKIEFRPEQVKLREIKRGLPDEPLSPYYDPLSGYIYLYPQLLPSDKRLSDERFIGSFTNELLHHLSLRLRRKETFSSGGWRRCGLMMVTRARENGGNGLLFEELDEGVVGITTRYILEKHFNYEYRTGWPVELVERICWATSEVNNLTLEDVFCVFQKAVFGRGRALELGKLIEKTWGKGGFRKLGQLIIEAQPRTEIGAGVWTITYERGPLLNFIREPHHSPPVAKP